MRLICSEVSDNDRRRIIRAMNDLRYLLNTMTVPQVRNFYSEFEAIRDGVSKLLDRADDKCA